MQKYVRKYVYIMTIVTATDFRKQMPRYIRESRENHVPITITIQSEEPMVMMPLNEWESLNETLYLVSTPANKQALDESIAELNQGLVVEHKLLQT